MTGKPARNGPGRYSHPATKTGIALALTAMVFSALLVVQIHMHRWEFREMESSGSELKKVHELEEKLAEYRHIKKYTVKADDANPVAPDILEVLDGKLRALSYSPLVKQMDSVSSREAGSFSIDEVSVRMSPFPGNYLRTLLEILEYQEPILRINRCEITRIDPERDEVDLTLNLQLWIQRSQPSG